MKFLVRAFLTLAFFVLALVVIGWLLSLRSVPAPEDIKYGVTFSKFRADELNIDWIPTYEAILTELGVKQFRFVAHWDMVEPVEGEFNFSELDYQMRRAEEEGAEVILAVGRRLPSWPECHEPDWVSGYTFEEQSDHILSYVAQVVNRYKDSPALKMWQVENEPFIWFYGSAQCGDTSEDVLDAEIALVRQLDPDTPILLTASGEIGFWDGTWSRADVFGTTLYRWVYSGEFGRSITYPTTPGFFRFKRTLTEITTGESRPAILAELAAEPWLKGANVDAPLEEQLAAMNVSRLEKTIDFASRTSFDEQYLWGAEWWYYLKEVHGEESVWNWAEDFFGDKP